MTPEIALTSDAEIALLLLLLEDRIAVDARFEAAWPAKRTYVMVERP